ncbi:hypothetical protein AVEN_160310-1 [Araneus ventricosus]|uniref:Uncharacterized protein n=1 Tax=Araneus ventricosus TaxID=182803 RepID=A0A4Y2FAN6_ARAVE|nr:hypothetical protein AVEN_160310-1 [Araneus ventricosus]
MMLNTFALYAVINIQAVILYTEEPEKLVHLSNIVKGQHEHTKVMQHDVAWYRLMSEGVLEVFHTMDPAGQSSKCWRVPGGGDLFRTGMNIIEPIWVQ